MSRILVILQFLLIALLAWPSAPVALSAELIAAGALFASGLALFGWSFATMPRSSFTVMPEPRRGNVLGKSGPYKFVRHPMYSSVLLCAIGAALAYSQTFKWLAVLALFVVLWIKLKREERLLAQLHPEYADYKNHTNAFIPFIL